MNISDVDVMLKKIDSEIEPLLDTKKALTSLRLSLSGSNGHNGSKAHPTGPRGPYKTHTFACTRAGCEDRKFKNKHSLSMHNFRKHTRAGQALSKRGGNIGGAMTKAKFAKKT